MSAKSGYVKNRRPVLENICTESLDWSSRATGTEVCCRHGKVAQHDVDIACEACWIYAVNMVAGGDAGFCTSLRKIFGNGKYGWSHRFFVRRRTLRVSRLPPHTLYSRHMLGDSGKHLNTHTRKTAPSRKVALVSIVVARNVGRRAVMVGMRHVVYMATGCASYHNAVSACIRDVCALIAQKHHRPYLPATTKVLEEQGVKRNKTAAEKRKERRRRNAKIKSKKGVTAYSIGHVSLDTHSATHLCTSARAVQLPPPPVVVHFLLLFFPSSATPPSPPPTSVSSTDDFPRPFPSSLSAWRSSNASSSFWCHLLMNHPTPPSIVVYHSSDPLLPLLLFPHVQGPQVLLCSVHPWPRRSSCPLPPRLARNFSVASRPPTAC